MTFTETTTPSQEITGKPADIARIVRNARKRPSFFIHGNTPLWINGGDSYLPLAGSVRVTRQAMLDYLADLQQTGERQEVHRGVELTIKMSILGTCYFV